MMVFRTYNAYIMYSAKIWMIHVNVDEYDYSHWLGPDYKCE